MKTSYAWQTRNSTKEKESNPQYVWMGKRICFCACREKRSKEPNLYKSNSIETAAQTGDHRSE